MPETIILTNTVYDVEVEYGRMMDTWRCLINEGYELVTPPSEEAWIAAEKQKPYSAYQPYDDINSWALNQGGGALTQELVAEIGLLQQTCPASALGGGKATFLLE